MQAGQEITNKAEQELRTLAATDPAALRRPFHQIRDYDNQLMRAIFLLPGFHAILDQHDDIMNQVADWFTADSARGSELVDHLVEHRCFQQAKQLISIARWSAKYGMIATADPGSVYGCMSDLDFLRPRFPSAVNTCIDYPAFTIEPIRYFAECGLFGVGEWATMIITAATHQDFAKVDQLYSIMAIRMPGKKAAKKVRKQIYLILLAHDGLEIDVAWIIRAAPIPSDDLFSFCFQTTRRYPEYNNDLHYRRQLLQVALPEITELSWNICQSLMTTRSDSKIIRTELSRELPKHLLQYASIPENVNGTITASSLLSVYASPNPLYMDRWFAFRANGMYFYLSDAMIRDDRIAPRTPSTHVFEYTSEPEWIAYGYRFQEQQQVRMPIELAQFIEIAGQNVPKSARSGPLP